jgi:hypothetical protein
MKPHPPGAVASLVFGILALLAGFIPIVLGIWALFAWYMPVLGVVFGVIAITSARSATRSLTTIPSDFEPGSVHTAGLVTGIIGLVLSLLVGLWCLMIIGLISTLISAATSGQPMTPVEQPLLW